MEVQSIGASARRTVRAHLVLASPREQDARWPEAKLLPTISVVKPVDGFISLGLFRDVERARCGTIRKRGDSGGPFVRRNPSWPSPSISLPLPLPLLPISAVATVLPVSTMSPWTAATRAVSHPLTHTRLAIRLNPARGDPARPFSPGDVLSGEAVLVVDNDEGVKDVKHKLSVQSVGVRVFWEARECRIRPRRAGSLSSRQLRSVGVTPLTSAVELTPVPVSSLQDPTPSRFTRRSTTAEDPCLCRSRLGWRTCCSCLASRADTASRRPGRLRSVHSSRARPGSSLLSSRADFYSSLPCQITLPEKSTVEESHNSSSKDKGKSSATVQLASGPPPSFAGESRSVEYIVEAAVVFADGAPSSELDERGHRVAGELELVTRTTFPFRPDGEKVMVSNEFSSAQWKKTLDVAGPEGRSLGTLNVAVSTRTTF